MGSSFISRVNWPQAIALTTIPIMALWALLNVTLYWKTAVWSVVYYFITGLGITAGYHRYWSHRSFDCSTPMEILLMLAATGSVEGSIKWWCRHHRAHHRFTDSDRDPYGAQHGFLWSHVGWMIMKEPVEDKFRGKVDISDLKNDPIVTFQHNNYLLLAPLMAIVFPTIVAGLGWGDWRGGYFYAGIARLAFVHQSTFCVNSLAHWLGEQTFDDRLTPRDHFLTAIVTLGEGYHNFHHEFPSDYRNAVLYWQYDPTKWVIWLASRVGLTYNLKVFPQNEIEKGRVMMQQKKIDEIKKRLNWGVPLDSLSTISWPELTKKVKDEGKQWLVIDGIAFDVSKFINDHPGGKGFLRAAIGRDVTKSFNGGIYYHSNAARNLITSMRVAKVEGVAPSNLLATED
ncbi:hypothetical protein HK096_008650 [Nowakowskiella sp. JEL0078]|nr:hypothetical protein HK096_008650 [Nowakowskiella sp. JEL0078]